MVKRLYTIVRIFTGRAGQVSACKGHSRFTFGGEGRCAISAWLRGRTRSLAAFEAVSRIEDRVYGGKSASASHHVKCDRRGACQEFCV